MCSKCFKDSQPEAGASTDSKSNKIIVLEDAKMEVQADQKAAEEEEKKPERPVQVRSLNTQCLFYIGKEE